MNRPNGILGMIFLVVLGAWEIGVCGCRTKDATSERSQSSQEVRNNQSRNSRPVSPSATLTWKASASVGRPSPDPVIGYNVYRGNRPHEYDPKPINSAPVEVPSYVDVTVERGKTYFYVTRTVTQSGVVSRTSNEVEAVIPQR